MVFPGGFAFRRPRRKTQQELDFERQDRLERERGDQRQIEVAFERYSEASVGIVAMVTATGPSEQVLARWFDLAAGALDAALCRTSGDHFRVAIWADAGDATEFRLAGAAKHNRNDSAIQRLSKQNTIAGHAWKSKAGEYLCGDISKDRKYKARSGTPRPYKSIFAIRLGEAAAPWGVMTIDVPAINRVSTNDLVVIRRFAKLISAAATIAVTKYTPTTMSPLPLSIREVMALPTPGPVLKEEPDAQP